MSKNNNYDTKSSILSIDHKDYKLPYDLSDSSRIVEHLEQSQEQLEFLKIKLTEAYEKLEREIRNNMELNQNYEELALQVKLFKSNWETEQRENKKLKEVMETMLKNRKFLEEEVEQTHKKYKKMIQQKNEQYQNQISELSKQVKKLKKENEILQEQLLSKNKRESVSVSKANYQRQKKLQQKIQILQNQLKKLTSEKVTQITRLKHEIQCYRQHNISPLRGSYIENHTNYRPQRIEYFDAESNNENINTNNLPEQVAIKNSSIVQSKITVTDSKNDDSISKWQRMRSNTVTELSDDQKLTRAQMEKKKVENQLIKIQRLKRHTPEDREAIAVLQKQIYELDSQISSLKRKIRQKY